MFHKICRVLVALFLKIFYRPKIKGFENLPKEGGFMLVCNHLSMIDCVVITTLFKQKIYFMAKKEIFNKKLKEKFFRWCGGIPVDRENLDLNSIKECFKTLKEGNVLVVFPEGTRNKKQEVDLLPIKGGASLLAFKASTKVVPVAMKSKFKMFRKNYLYIGEAYDFKEYKGRRLDAELTDKLTEDMSNKLLDCLQKAREFAEETEKK